MSLEELSISIVNVKQEIDGDDKLDIMRTVLNEHDYIIVKKENDTDNNNGMDEEEEDLSEEEELVDFDDEAEADKIQAAQTLAELSMMHGQGLVSSHPMCGVSPRPRLTSDERLTLPDLRRTSPGAEAGHNTAAGVRFACNVCGKQYSTSSNLARHRQTHRSPDHSKARRCHLCHKVYVSMPAFSMHMRTHTAGHDCQVCGKTFSRPWLLKGHMRTHTGEKPYSCPICQKSFSDKSNLRAHLQTHSASRPHSCDLCGKTFALKSYLVKHKETSCNESNDYATTLS